MFNKGEANKATTGQELIVRLGEIGKQNRRNQNRGGNTGLSVAFEAAEAEFNKLSTLSTHIL